jgi:deazaflavin-dependent oxidoreductase (nitroreductase family)
MTIADDRRPGAAASRPGSRPSIRRANRVITGLQRAGIVFGPMHVLTVRGRKTGKLRTTPVAVIPVGGARYVFQAYPGASWVANATAAGSGVLARGWRRRPVRLILVPTCERGPILRELPARSRVAAGIFLRSGMVAAADAAGFEAAAPRIAVFRVEDAAG